MDLCGKLLIAMPGMSDPRFARSVVYLCAYSDSGAMGLIVNKPLEDLTFRLMLEQLKIPTSPAGRDIKVHFGGPVEHGRGFVLHSGDYHRSEGTLRVDEHFALTATLDILQDLALGGGPEASFLALGYAGWGPGQLEAEIGQNGWLSCDAAPDLVFSDRNPDKWALALKSLGVDPLTLSARAGRA